MRRERCKMIEIKKEGMMEVERKRNKTNKKEAVKQIYRQSLDQSDTPTHSLTEDKNR